jgi:hypothetical protein
MNHEFLHDVIEQVKSTGLFPVPESPKNAHFQNRARAGGECHASLSIAISCSSNLFPCVYKFVVFLLLCVLAWL